MITIIKGRLIDGISNQPIKKGLVAFQNNKIIYAGEAESYVIPESSIQYDIGDGTILPGFIDCHAHLTGEENAGSWANGKMFGDQLMGAAYQAGLLLQSGFTGIRDMSEAGLYVSRAVERGILSGPRILCGGRVLGITSGHVECNPEESKEYYNEHNHLSYLVDGVDDCILGVRKQFRQGAAFIKICATGGISSPTDRVDDVQFSPEELEAIVSEAKRHHSYVCAHCTGNEGAYQAIHAGVECIEHGTMLTQREIDLMAEKDITLVTTLWISLHVADLPGFPDWMHDKACQCATANRHTIEMARKAGIRIAFGSDFTNSPNTPFSHLGQEFEAMIEAGMTEMEAIQAATVNAAHLMKSNNIGSLVAGNLADITVTDGNPLTDIHCLSNSSHIKLVVVDGKIVKNSL